MRALIAALTRAEPVAALYEQGRVSHIGHHAELEEQPLNFTGAVGERSPDRLDAATCAITDLMGYGLRRHAEELPMPIPYTDEIRDPAVGLAVGADLAPAGGDRAEDDWWSIGTEDAGQSVGLARGEFTRHRSPQPVLALSKSRRLTPLSAR